MERPKDLDTYVKAGFGETFEPPTALVSTLRSRRDVARYAKELEARIEKALRVMLSDRNIIQAHNGKPDCLCRTCAAYRILRGETADG